MTTPDACWPEGIPDPPPRAPDDPVAAFHPRLGAGLWGITALFVIGWVLVLMTLPTQLDKLVYVVPLTTHGGFLRMEVDHSLVAVAMLGAALVLFVAYRLVRGPSWLAVALWFFALMVGFGGYGPN